MKDLILQTGSPVLRAVAAPVPKKDFGSAQLTTLIKKMKTALKKEEFGVALAAPQVGASLRIFIVSEKVFEEKPKDTSQRSSGLLARRQTSSRQGEARPFVQHLLATHPLVFVNPEITRLSRTKREMSEGCLSVRGVYGSVLRHERASIKAHDEHGKAFVHHASGLLAHIFQHECDHLEGVLYTDVAEKLVQEKTDA